MAQSEPLMVDVGTPRLVGYGIAGFLATEIIMVACAFLWVFIYSALINTGGDQASYEAYAQTASPVVAVVVAGPVFFLMGRYFLRLGPRARTVAIAVVIANLAVDFPVVILMAEDLGYNVIMALLSAAGKIIGAWYGTRAAAT